MPDNNIQAELVLEQDIQATLFPSQGIQTQLDLVYLCNPNEIDVKHDDTLVGRGTTPSPLGISGDLLKEIHRGGNTFIFEFDASQTVWTIEHNLGKCPAITVVDSAKTEVECEKSYPDENTTVIKFNAPFKGTAYLN